MRFLDLFKTNQKKEQKNNSIPLNSFGEPLDKLVDGELPWGWCTYYSDFTDKIHNEYSHFLHDWINSRTSSPKEQYSTLKSLILYLEDVEKLCKAKGECFEFWFYHILITTDYIEKRKAELEELSINLEQKQDLYLKKKSLLEGLEQKVIKELQKNDGMLQSDFIKLFDEIVKVDVSNILYHMSKSGKLERIKSGRSYILHYRS